MTGTGATSDRLMDLVARVTGRGGRRSERTERRLLAVALVVFVVAGVVAVRRLPPLPDAPDPRWLPVVLALGAGALWINAAEFRWSAAALDVAVDRREALRVSTLASAANVLPIPGSVAIRTRALLQGGRSLRSAAVVTGAVGLAWVASAAIAAAALLLVVLDERALALVCLVGGVAGWVLAGLVIGRTTGARWSLLRLAAIEAVSVTASAVRLHAVAETLGLGVSLAQAAAVNLGGILSNVAGFLPGGLGLREISSGVFGALVGMPASAGVLMAAVDRILFYAVLGVAAVALLRGRGTAATPGDRRAGGPDVARPDDAPDDTPDDATVDDAMRPR